MPYSQRQYEIASRRTGVPVALLKIVDGQEGNGVSPAGARGEMQLMPGTARGLERKYKINTRTRMGNLLGGAYYLKEQHDAFKTWRLALAAYNAGPGAVRQYDGIPPYQETQNYVSSIMRRFQQAGGASPVTPARANTTPGIPLSSPGPPQFDRKALALSSSQDIAAGHYDPIEELRSLHEAMLTASSGGGKVSTGRAEPPPVPQTGDWSKYVQLGKGADRHGVSTSPEVLQFVGMIGARAGRRLTIGTGTNHNQFVVGTQRESDHWTGHAADIPAVGKQLTRLGRQALIAAGMSPKDAGKAKGGIYNVGRYQIIFNTNEGGNHFNHLHVGVRGG